MRMQLPLFIVAVAMQAFAFGEDSLEQDAPGTGVVVLQAIDADTKEPVPGVEFFKFNSLAEDWFSSVGKTNARGRLSVHTAPIPGYYYSVWRTPDDYKWQAPSGYKVTSLDDVASNVVAGRTVTHRFHLRKPPAQDTFPGIKELPTDRRQQHIPLPVRQKDNVHLESMVDALPGFPAGRVRFWFYPNEDGEATQDQLELAERIFHNGTRVYAAVQDELRYFQNAETHDQGKIENIRDVLIQIRGPRIWHLWCRLPDGLPLKQHGYRVCFDQLDSWDLQIPDYLQPGF